MNFEEILKTIGNWLTTEGLKIALVVIVFAIGCQVINFICNRLDKRLEKRKLDETLRKVLIPTIRRIVKLIMIACAIGYLGFETSSISAAILSIGTTIGLALQGSLSNLAGGILIIILRPYKLGDYISVDDNAGTVSEIALFYTHLTTSDNKEIIIPNSKTSSACVINYSKNKTRRNDLEFSISYSEDFEKAKTILKKVVESNALILNEPEPFINIKTHGDSAIIILVRYWTKSEDYWKVQFAMLEDVKKAFDENNISIPFPQLDIHLDNK